MPKHLMSGMLLILVLFSISGCAAVLLGVGGGAGAGTVAYLKGELKTTLEASLNSTLRATRQAMDDLNFFVTGEQADAVSAQLTVRGSNDTKTEIKLKKISENLTTIRIRVGIFGNESLSRLILERIKRNL